MIGISCLFTKLRLIVAPSENQTILLTITSDEEPKYVRVNSDSLFDSKYPFPSNHWIAAQGMKLTEFKHWFEQLTFTSYWYFWERHESISPPL